MKLSISKQLGLVQEDLALLLQVSRSQLSLYELGKRDLPVAAKIKLTEMLSFVQDEANEAHESISNLKNQETEKKKIIEEFLFVNKRKQMTLDKKINTIIKKQQTTDASLRLSIFLNTKSSKSIHFDKHLSKSIESKAKINLIKSEWSMQFKLQLKKEVLQIEEKHLESILKKL